MTLEDCLGLVARYMAGELLAGMALADALEERGQPRPNPMTCPERPTGREMSLAEAAAGEAVFVTEYHHRGLVGEDAGGFWAVWDDSLEMLIVLDSCYLDVGEFIDAGRSRCIQCAPGEGYFL